MIVSNIEIKWQDENMHVTQEETNRLIEEGFERAVDLMEQGYLEGELCGLLNDGETDIYGWWSVSR